MRKSFDDEIGSAIKLLMEYDNLVEHDDLDCQNPTFPLSFAQKATCTFRKYLCTLISLACIGATALLLKSKVVRQHEMKLL